MRKIKLDLDTLVVESFVAGAGDGVGTVRARDSMDQNFDTIQATCGQNNTCAAAATCDTTCKPFTQQPGCGGGGGGGSAIPAQSCACPPETTNSAEMDTSCGYPNCTGPFNCDTHFCVYTHTCYGC